MVLSVVFNGGCDIRQLPRKKGAGEKINLWFMNGNLVSTCLTRFVYYSMEMLLCTLCLSGLNQCFSTGSLITWHGRILIICDRYDWCCTTKICMHQEFKNNPH